MKKIILVLLVAAIIAVGSVSLAGCSPDVPVPGIAWANNETLTYDIKDGETSIGTLTVTTSKIAAGDHIIERFRPEPFSISGGVSAGTRIVKRATDTDGNEIMYSESLLNGFTSLASYKKVNFGGKNYELRVYHEGKHFYYAEGGNGFQRIKAKSGYADNELLYNIIRCYDIGVGYSSSYSVLSPLSESLEKVSVSTSTAAAAAFELNYTDRNGAPAQKQVNCITATFTKTDSPSGRPITVWYAPSDFQLLGNVNIANNKSIFLPVKIIENNLTYSLTGATTL